MEKENGKIVSLHDMIGIGGFLFFVVWTFLVVFFNY